MRVLVVTYPTPKDIRKVVALHESDYIIAVDQAVLALYKQRISINLAVGDFDSLTNQGILSQLNVIRLNPVKDVTDTHQALIEASKIDADELILIGGIGGERIEHFIVHTMLLNQFPKVKIMDDFSTIYLLNPGLHTFKDPSMFYSFFAYPKATLSLSGFKYPLIEYLLNTYDSLCISNEIEQTEGLVHIKEGMVLVVISKK
jgi:thiamine pyrophosphokinase